MAGVPDEPHHDDSKEATIMTDLDIDIDIPDDDDLHAPPPVLDNGDNPPVWPKLAAAALVIAAIAGYGYLSSPDPEPSAAPPPATESTPATTAPTTAPLPDPETTQMLAAVDAWERFAATGDLAAVADSFDGEGPQHALFSEQADQGADPVPLRFEAAETGITRSDDLVTVSTELTVTAPDGQATVYPYDFVFLGDSTAVWTVIDRRAPGTPTLPPSPQIVSAAERTWTAIADAIRSGDLATAATFVTDGGMNDSDAVSEPVFTGTQQAAIADGRLHTWTQISPTQVIASLDVDGIEVATVPFALDGDQWLFDHATATEIGSTP